MTVYVYVRLADVERTCEWRPIDVDELTLLESLKAAIKVAEQMPDVEVCLEASHIAGGVET